MRHVILVTAMLVLVCTAAFGDTPGNLERMRARALELVNEARSKHGLAPLSSEPRLTAAAQGHAEGMLEGGYYGHVSPEGEAPMDRYLDAGGERWRIVRENIARCGTCEPPATVGQIERLHQGWMESAGHRRNILAEGLTRFGFGAAIGGRPGLYAVQMFAGPGTSPGLEAGEESEALSQEEQLDRAVALINRARRRAQVPPLEPSETLTEAARGMLPTRTSDGFTLGAIDTRLDAVPEPERGRWRALAVVAGQCGGCGVEPTAADLRHFRSEWLDDQRYESTLLDLSFTHFGFAMRADGEGRKVAVALLGSR